jgi:hypothetical protein
VGSLWGTNSKTLNLTPLIILKYSVVDLRIKCWTRDLNTKEECQPLDCDLRYKSVLFGMVGLLEGSRDKGIKRTRELSNFRTSFRNAQVRPAV